MKRIVLIIVLSFIVSLSSHVFADVITLRADVWCPYNCQPNTEKPGFIIEIAKYAFERAGHTIDYQNLPWPRAIKLTREGQYNAIVGAYQGDAPDFIFPENELGLSSTIFYALKENNWKFTGIDSLKSVKVGVIQDYSYGTEVDDYIKQQKGTNQIQIVFGENVLEQNIKKLLLKRVDTIIEDGMVFNYHLQDKKLSQNLFQIAGTSKSDKIYIAFSPKIKKSAEYAKILSDALQKMRESGELKKILNKYGLQDWK